ncbi:MAG: CvpA family protein [Bacteroidales bacterium]
MNYPDIILSLILAYGIYTGLRRGLVMQLVALFILILGAYIAFKLSFFVGIKLSNFGVGATVIPALSFTITFVGVALVANTLGKIANNIIKITMLGWLNKLLGVLLSTTKTLVALSIVLTILNHLDSQFGFLSRTEIEKSKLYQPISSIVPALVPHLNFDKIKTSAEELDKQVDEQINKFK